MTRGTKVMARGHVLDMKTRTCRCGKWSADAYLTTGQVTSRHRDHRLEMRATA